MLWLSSRMRRVLLAIAMSLVVGTAAAAPDAAPKRVVSTSLCADQLTLLLVPRENILSLSWVGSDPHVSNLYAEAAGIPQNSAKAEEVVVLRPDFVMADLYSGGMAKRFAALSSTPLHLVRGGESIDDVRAIVREAAAALHLQSKGEEILRGLDARLAAIKPAKGDVTALVYEPNGITSAAGTLTHDVLQAAGLRNLASELLDGSYGTVALETVIAHPPDLLVIDNAYGDSASRAQGVLNHPALAALKGRTKIISVHSRLWLCPGPWIADAVERLAAEKTRIVESRSTGLARP